MARHQSSVKDDPLDGAGPFKFSPSSDITAGDSKTWNFDREPRNGREGGYRKYLPFDEITITNQDASQTLDYTVNGIYDGIVVPNAQETFADAGVNVLQVSVPSGGTTISSSDIHVEAIVYPYNADKRAREQARKGPAAQVLEKFTGLSFGGR